MMRNTTIAQITIMIALSVLSCFYSISLVRCSPHMEMSGVFRYDLDGKWRCGLNVTIINDYDEPVILHWISLEVAEIFYLDGTYELLDYLLNDTSINIVISAGSNRTFSYNLAEAGFDKEPKSMTVWCRVSTDKYSLAGSQNIVSENNYPVHNFNTSLNYQSIQKAIDANETLNGHIIGVEAGTYYEHVVVNKSLTLIGEDRETTIIDGNETGNVVLIEANNVTVRDFTVQRGIKGFYLSGDFNTVESNTVTNSSYGILLSHSNYNNVTGCEVTYNDGGIFIYSSDENTVTQNSVIDNDYGIQIEYSQGNILSFNNMTSNLFNFGIHGETSSSYNNSINPSNTINNKPVYYLTEQSHIVINSSTFPNIGYLALINSTDVQVEGLTLANNYQGVLLAYTNNSVIMNLDISDSYYGVSFVNSNWNVVTENTVADSFYFGIFVGWGSTNNSVFHNNFVNNTNQAYGTQYTNEWDDGCEGNFWSDFAGSDSNGDGIGDTPYIIDGGNQDNYPLMNPYWNSADINHDLTVDIFDVVLACVAYSSTPSDLNWNCHCDITEPYGTIDIFDIVIICSSYGEEYTP